MIMSYFFHPDECNIMCTFDWRPLCVLDVTDPSQGRKIKTYGNECEMKSDATCNKKRLLKLYDGECRNGKIYHLYFTFI